MATMPAAGPSGGPLIPLLVTNEASLSTCKCCPVTVSGHGVVMAVALSVRAVSGPGTVTSGGYVQSLLV